jgi:chloride channel protein, CIC family
MLSFLGFPILFLKTKLSERNFLIVSSIFVGLMSGLAAVVLKYAVHAISHLISDPQTSTEFIIIAAFPLAGILLSIFFVRHFLGNNLKKGSAEISYAIVKKSSLIPSREMFGHLVTSALTVGFGGSLGLESPMVSTGSAIGSNYGRIHGLSYKERTLLLGCGAAAGIAAAFNSPIAGVLFAIEVLLTDVAAASFIPLIISAASGALLSKIILAEGVTLAFVLKQPFNYTNVPFYILLGILCAAICLVYRKLFTGTEARFHQIKNAWLRALVGGALLFTIIILFPPLFGEGYESVRLLENRDAESLADGSILHSVISSDWSLLIFIGALAIFKIMAAAITIGSGGNGGSFAPSLVIGSYVGFVFARIVNNLGLGNLPVSNFTLVSMAGILSGIFYAPLTAVFLIAEITGGYDLIIPLMIVSALSLALVHFFEPHSMEGVKLAKKLHSTVETRDKLLLSRLDVADLIETNFSTVQNTAKLKDLVHIISASNRNIFPVLDKGKKLVGIIHLDRIRGIMFDSSKYDSVLVADLMTKPPAIVELDENLHEILVKFDQTNQWNLPVVDHGIYIGFLSKSYILTRYRNELMEFS